MTTPSVAVYGFQTHADLNAVRSFRDKTQQKPTGGKPETSKRFPSVILSRADAEESQEATDRTVSASACGAAGFSPPMLIG